MKVALISLSSEGMHVIRRLAASLPEACVYLHESVGEEHDAARFSSIVQLTREIFHSYEWLVYIAPCGVVVRAIAPNIKSKPSDPAVVVVDVVVVVVDWG